MNTAPTAIPQAESTPEHGSMRGFAVIAGLALVVCLCGAGVWQFQLYRLLPMFAAAPVASFALDDPVQRVKDNRAAILVSQEVIDRLKITTTSVSPAAPNRPLELAGSLGLNTDKLNRVRSLFAGEVVEIQTTNPERGPDGHSLTRSLRVGDFVEANQLLAVVWSADFGQKKSDLVDALSQMAADEAFLKRYDSLDRSGIVPEFTIMQARRNSEQSRINAQRAENSLRTAKMTDDEIKKLENELRELATKPLTSEDRAKLKEWARVEIRARISGTIVEKNANPGDIIDPSMDLFKISDMSRLMVWAQVREEDLPTLMEKKLPIQWTVNLTTDPQRKPLEGEIVHISPIIDPTQHTALAMGYVNNPEGRLRGAQFINATVKFATPERTVAIPTTALVEDGRDSIVFVQPEPSKRLYVQKHVKVVKHYAHLVYVSNDLTIQEVKDGLQTLEPGDLVVVRNALGLKAALEDVQSKK